MKKVRWPAESRFEIEVQGMLGMSLLSFLIVTLIGAVVAVAYHHVIRYRFLEGMMPCSGS